MDSPIPKFILEYSIKLWVQENLKKKWFGVFTKNMYDGNDDTNKFYS